MNNNTKMAAIAVKNNRLKTYKTSSDLELVYLKDGDEFQIELFNPRPTPVLAKIWMNDKLISESGLVIQPGQRFFLERYIDTNNKFVFKTYSVDGTHSEVIKAIENNGAVTVIFYPEKIKANSDLWKNPSWREWNLNQPSIQPNTSQPYWTTDFRYNGTVPSFNTTITTSNTAFYSSNTSVAGSLNVDMTNFETGRVEKGGKTDQYFTEVNMEFENFPCQTVKMKIMAESNKPVEVNDIRNYCSNCGTRMKKQTWKFCPNCGTKID